VFTPSTVLKSFKSGSEREIARTEYPFESSSSEIAFPMPCEPPQIMAFFMHN